MKKTLLVLLLLLNLFPVFGQQEAAIWYFGRNAGLDFNSGVPVPLTNGQLNTYEGCATIADTNGNLLFYTDGITVWNRNHTTMANGFGLLGDPSSTQSGIIVPKPGNPNNYFVFTTGAADNPVGLHYSEIDMTQNGGLGAVMTKNGQLVSPSTEKLTAVQHANGTDYWVLAHGWENDAFLAYLVTAAGVTTTPVTSNVGIDLANPGPFGGRSINQGYMKASPDGTKIGVCYVNIGAELLDFDPATGVVSNPITLNNERGSYGIEFSPDSNVLYVSYAFFVGFNFELRSNVYQYDVSTNNAAAIQASATLVSPVQTIEIGALQLAIDGKIYVAQFDQTYLGVINNPNTLGVGCNYVENGVALSGRQSSLGLPPFVQSFFLSGIMAQNFCLGDGTEFSITSSEPILNIQWDFGDGNTSTQENPAHTYAATGIYTVSVTVTTASDTATEVKDIVITDTPVANAVTDVEVCSELLTTTFDFSTKDMEVLGGQSPIDNAVSYHPTLADAQVGSNALTDPYTNTNPQETIYARIYSIENPSCHDVTDFDILVKQQPVPSAIPDEVVVCDDDGDGQYTFDLVAMRTDLQANENPIFSEVSFHTSQADADNAINPLPDSYTNTLPVETIVFRIQNQTYPECYATGEIRLEVIGEVMANTPTDISICDNDNDGFYEFDLTTKDTEILGAQAATDFEVSYHASQVDAESNVNPLNANAFTNTVPYTQTVYARVENRSNPQCYNTVFFGLLVSDTPNVNTVDDWLVCDDDNDGIHIFDLTEKNSEVLGGQSPTDFSVSYHENLADAQGGLNAIVSPYTNSSNPQQVFFRIENNNNANCFVTGDFMLEVLNGPTANAPEDIVVCDDAETGRYTFDLTILDAEILNGQNASDYYVAYFASELDALNNGNPLNAITYQNNQLNETLFARITHNRLETCYDVTGFGLLVNPLPQPDLQERYVICPDSPDLTIDGGDFESWEWRNENNEAIGAERTINIQELGNFSLTVTETQNGMTCEKTVGFVVVSSGAPEVLSVNTSGFSDVITLTIEASGIGEFEYSVDGVNFQTSNVFEVFPGEYTVFVRDPFECRTLTEVIFVIGYQKFFTPNGDSINEYWNIIGAENYPASLVTIYDRYGKLIKQVSPTGEGWDGTYLGNPLPASDYWFKFEYDGGKVVTGHFTLKR